MAEIPWSVGQLVAGLWMPRAGEGKAEERQKREGSSWLPGDPQVSLPLARSSSAQICPPAPQAMRALTLTAGPGPGPGEPGQSCSRSWDQRQGLEQRSWCPRRAGGPERSSGTARDPQPTRQQGEHQLKQPSGQGCLLQAKSDPAAQRASSGAGFSGLGGDSKGTPFLRKPRAFSDPAHTLQAGLTSGQRSGKRGDQFGSHGVLGAEGG